MRNVPVGGGCRKNKSRSKPKSTISADTLSDFVVLPAGPSSENSCVTNASTMLLLTNSDGSDELLPAHDAPQFPTFAAPNSFEVMSAAMELQSGGSLLELLSPISTAVFRSSRFPAECIKSSANDTTDPALLDYSFPLMGESAFVNCYDNTDNTSEAPHNDRNSPGEDNVGDPKLGLDFDRGSWRLQRSDHNPEARDLHPQTTDPVNTTVLQIDNCACCCNPTLKVPISDWELQPLIRDGFLDILQPDLQLDAVNYMDDQFMAGSVNR